MALFDKLLGKNKVLEPETVDAYSLKLSDEELKIMQHEVVVPERPKTKEEIELDVIDSILSSPIPEGERAKYVKKIQTPKEEPKVEPQEEKGQVEEAVKEENMITTPPIEETPKEEVIIEAVKEESIISSAQEEVPPIEPITNEVVPEVQENIEYHGEVSKEKVIENIEPQEELKEQVEASESEPPHEIIIIPHEIIMIRDDIINTNHEIIYIE